jgi:precorrin-6B methylase 2
MNHADHVALIEEATPPPDGTWADFGSGTGPFSLVLAELIGATGVIYAIDKEGDALSRQEEAMRRRFPDL